MPTNKELLQLEYDKKQLQFSIDGTLIINKKIINEKTPIFALINSSNYWICPFCLETSNEFMIENKGLIVCPNCLIGMRLKTLLFIKECSNQEYARWVFEYRLSGFFSKLKSGKNSFEKWNQKMKELGISYEFWEEYKKLRGDKEKEDKEEYVDNKIIETFIDVLAKKINEGLTKEQIIVELYDIEVTTGTIDYCYNEALLRVKRGNKI